MGIVRLCALVLALGAVMLLFMNTMLISLVPGRISSWDRDALEHLQRDFHKCVQANGIGIYSRQTSLCKVKFFFSEDTKAKWRDEKTGMLEALEYDIDLCEAVIVWEQVRNSSTILTKEYIDGLPNGWHDYAWRRINKGSLLNMCENKPLCEEKLAKVLPDVPPFLPRQFQRCAVVGNSGDLLNAGFGREIDTYDAVVRHNGAPTENYTEYVGTKRTFRLLNRGSAKALDKVAAMDGTGKEVLIIKTTVHDAMNRMIEEVPIVNPVYLMLGSYLGSSAKGTGVKGLELALSVCESVDIYGFTVDPGYTTWSRYFSESRGGHTPLLGRAYYQMMECLGLIKIHSPLRMQKGATTNSVPGRKIIQEARRAAERIKRKAAGGREHPLASCVIWKDRSSQAAPPLLFNTSKQSAKHQKYIGGVAQYPLEHSLSNGMLCVRP